MNDEVRPRRWWELSTLFPRNALDPVIWGALGASALFLVLTVVGFSSASGARRELERMRADLGATLQEVETLSERPTQKELSKAEKLARDCREALEEARQDRAEHEKAFKEKAAELLDVKGALMRAKEETKRLATAKEALEVKLRGMTERYNAARKAASGKSDLLDRLDDASTQLEEFEIALARERRRAQAREEAWREKSSEYEAEIKRLEGDLGEAHARIERLVDELGEFPLEPLPDELAEARYHEILDEVARHEDRQKRIDILFRSKLILAGTPYEDKADAAWRRELREKQADVDRAARAVYEDVRAKIRLHPSAHDENVKLLTEAQEKVRGSRYESSVQRLIDLEHEKKALGR